MKLTMKQLEERMCELEAKLASLESSRSSGKMLHLVRKGETIASSPNREDLRAQAQGGDRILPHEQWVKKFG